MLVIGAHWPAEHEGRGVGVWRFGQGLAELRAADVQQKALLHEQAAKPPRIGETLMDNTEDRAATHEPQYSGSALRLIYQTGSYAEFTGLEPMRMV